MIQYKALRDRILEAIDENDGDLDLQGEAVLQVLIEEGLFQEDDQTIFLDDEESNDEEW